MPHIYNIYKTLPILALVVTTTTTTISPLNRSPITIAIQTSLTPLRQRRPRLQLHRTPQTPRPLRIPILRRNQIPIPNDPGGLVPRILYLCRSSITHKIIRHVRQKHHRDRLGIITPEERRTLIQPLRHERRVIRHRRHLGQSHLAGAQIRVSDFAAVGEVVVRVGAVVVHDDDGEGTLGLDQGPERVVLVAEAAVGEVELGLGRDQGRARAAVEGVGEDAIGVVRGGRVGARDDVLQGARQGAVGGRDDAADVGEDVGRGAEDVA